MKVEDESLGFAYGTYCSANIRPKYGQQKDELHIEQLQHFLLISS
jgi:hypothetical protein